MTWLCPRVCVVPLFKHKQVVGFSVDYTLHLSDSYLESESAKRGDRVKDMLTHMGPSVLSG